MSVESPKSKQAEDRLPGELKPIYKRMVEEYSFLTNNKSITAEVL